MVNKKTQPERTLAEVLPDTMLARDLDTVAYRAEKGIIQLGNVMLAPDAIKAPPTFTLTQLAKLCDLERHQINYRLQQGKLPQGSPQPAQATGRIFSLAETQTWISATKVNPTRNKDAGEKAAVIAVSNFKGGVGKTSTAMALAQGLTLRGLRVLAIDSDPQGSFTALHGISSGNLIPYESTLAVVCDGTEASVRPLIQKTYWPNLDLVPAATSLYTAEFVLPARQKEDLDFEFWNVLADALESVRGEYDVIVIDTSPSLSYLTLNALMAATICLVPIPPESLDYISLSQFWRLFSDLVAQIETHTQKHSKRANKKYNGVHLLLSKVEDSNSATPLVRAWLEETYGNMLLKAEIPKSAVVSNSSTEFGTVYDISRYSGSYKTYARIREAYDNMIDKLMPSIKSSWRTSAAEHPMPVANISL